MAPLGYCKQLVKSSRRAIFIAMFVGNQLAIRQSIVNGKRESNLMMPTTILGLFCLVRFKSFTRWLQVFSDAHSVCTDPHRDCGILS